MNNDYAIIGFALFLGALFVGGAIIVSKLLAFKTPHSSNKQMAYECSERPVGNARIQFKIGYYIFALLFLIFDVESLFLFPCLQIFKSVMDSTASIQIEPSLLMIELGIFVFILATGLVYAWKKEVLRWE